MKDPVIVMDNVEAMRILTDVGLVDKLTPLDGFNSTHVLFHHQQCHCIGIYHRGHADERDNGFMVVMIPDDMISEKEAETLMMEIIHSTNNEGGKVKTGVISTGLSLS